MTGMRLASWVLFGALVAACDTDGSGTTTVGGGGGAPATGGGRQPGGAAVGVGSDAGGGGAGGSGGAPGGAGGAAGGSAGSGAGGSTSASGGCPAGWACLNGRAVYAWSCIGLTCTYYPAGTPESVCMSQERMHLWCGSENANGTGRRVLFAEVGSPCRTDRDCSSGSRPIGCHPSRLVCVAGAGTQCTSDDVCLNGCDRTRGLCR